MKQISRAELIGWQMAPEMVAWFDQRFPRRIERYQHVLDALAREDRCTWANQLMDRAGADPDRSVGFAMEERVRHVFAAGTLSTPGSIRVNGFVRVAGDIEIGHSLRADAGISCEGSVATGGSIQTDGCLTIRGGSKVGGSVVALKGIVVRDDLTAEEDIVTEAGDIDAEGRLEAGGTIFAAGFVRAASISAEQGLFAATDVVVQGGLECGGDVRIGGDLGAMRRKLLPHVEVKGDLLVDGNAICEAVIRANRIQIGRSLRCARWIASESDVIVAGNLTANGRVSSWHGHIRVGGDFTAHGRVLAGRDVVVVGEIRLDPAAALLAGTIVAPDDWAREGRVIVPVRPDRMLTGIWMATEPGYDSGDAGADRPPPVPSSTDDSV